MGSVVYTQLPKSPRKPAFKSEAEKAKAQAEHLAFLRKMGVKPGRNAVKF